MKHLVTQPHFILSVENSPYRDKVTSPVSHNVAIKALQRLGGNNVHEIQGHYGSPERSIFISNPSDEQKQFARHLANVTGQESHIESDGYSHKMIFNHGPDAGKIVHGKGTIFHQEKPKDFYSTLPSGEHFTHHFDFGKTESRTFDLLQKTDIDRLQPLIKGDPTTSEEVNTLMNRVEDKYSVSREYLDKLTQALREKLKEGDIDTSVRYNTNQTIYLDNKDMDAFRDNMEGIKPRFKVRIRRYAPNGDKWEDVAYVELKIRLPDGMTRKLRVRIPEELISDVSNGKMIKVDDKIVDLNRDISRQNLWKRVVMMNSIISKYGFKKQIVVIYERRAYSNNSIRVTIDDNIRYFDARKIDEDTFKLITDSSKWEKFSEQFKKIKEKDLLILEVKHEDDTASWIDSILDEVKAKDIKFSKYCAAVVNSMKDEKEEGSITRPKKMDHSAIMASVLEDDVNKAETLAKAPIAYHGSPWAFEEHSVPKKTKTHNLNYGPGIYYTESPEEASEYAQPQIHRDLKTSRALIDLHKDPKYKAFRDKKAKEYGLESSVDTRHPNWGKFADEMLQHDHRMVAEKMGMAPNVRRSDVQVKNPFDPHNEQHAIKVAKLIGYDPKNFKSHLKNDGESFYSKLAYAIGGDNDNWSQQTNKLNAAIKRAGFDGIHDKVAGHIIAFHPKQVKPSLGSASKKALAAAEPPLGMMGLLKGWSSKLSAKYRAMRPLTPEEASEQRKKSKAAIDAAVAAVTAAQKPKEEKKPEAQTPKRYVTGLNPNKGGK